MEPVVVVTGSRLWRDRRKLWAMLDAADPGVVIHGGAEGADAVATEWCKSKGRIAVIHFPDYSNRAPGLSPPLRRNIQMLEAYDTALVLAFPMPSSRGTRHTIAEACKRNMRVIVSEGS